MFVKRAEATITADNIKINAMDQDDPEIISLFKKKAADLKALAPRADGFLYFTCIMMHAAEAACLDDNGKIKKLASGEDVKSWWDVNDSGSWKWNSNDKNLKPYKNANGDIFPRDELKKAYKKWVTKPLCIDHQSSSSEHVRGVIVDVVYDDKKERLVALCALDKIGFPDLARKVASGYSTNVSMGTAVGRAICTDCGRVARVEADFCSHMKGKCSYGEINVDLSPIELSIVVNGADPRAKIRRIIASAGSVATYVENEIKKDLTDSEISKLADQIRDQINEIEEIEAPYRGGKEMVEAEVSNIAGNSPQAPAVARYASVVTALNALKEKLGNFINKIASDKESIKNTNEDKQMVNEKKAYLLGGGGVNEPATPGQVKYEKEDAESIRNNDDKQMSGQMDMGPIDGIHPGYDSFGESETERKKKLLRMATEIQQRSLRRAAAVSAAKLAADQKKEAYLLGGGGVNEPTPGKPKYPKEDAETIRNKEDKQMAGKSPFPNVGKIDGLYDGDQALKEKLCRASKLSAVFTKALNLPDSRWDIYRKAEDGSRELILSASVQELVGKERVGALYSAVATKDYGSKIMSTIRTAGLDTAKDIFKSAQTAAPSVPAMATPGGAPSLPLDANSPAAAPIEDDADYLGETGTPAEQVKTLVTELGNVQADLEQAVEALESEELPEAGAGPVATASIRDMQITLHAALTKGLKKSIAEISETVDELELCKKVTASKITSKKEADFAKEIIVDAFKDAQKAKKTAANMIASFIRYAHGVEAITKQAQFTGESMSEPEQNMSSYETEQTGQNDPELEELLSMLEGTGDELAPQDEFAADTCEADTCDARDKKSKKEKEEDKKEKEEEEEEKEKEKAEKEEEEDEDEDDKNDIKVEIDDQGKFIGTTASTREERDIMRVKLAQKGLTFSDMLQKAHPKSTVVDFDTKPSGDGAKVETLTEVHDKMMDIATATVKKTADKINKLVSQGKINPKTDFPALIAQGLDQAAVSYWKKFWGEAKDSEASNFASELVKERSAKKAAADEKALEVKVARSYEMAYEMSKRGLVAGDPASLSKEASRIRGFSDENFSYLKDYVQRTPVKVATAGTLPVVGTQNSIFESVESILPRAQPSNVQNEYDALFAGRKF